MWRVIRAWDGGDPDDVIVRHDLHRNLRANGRYRRWHTGVTVDDTFAPWSTMMRWTVQAIPTRAASPEIRLPVATPVSSQSPFLALIWAEKGSWNL
jgi:hypothetical protein